MLPLEVTEDFLLLLCGSRTFDSVASHCSNIGPKCLLIMFVDYVNILYMRVLFPNVIQELEGVGTRKRHNFGLTLDGAIYLIESYVFKNWQNLLKK